MNNSETFAVLFRKYLENRSSREEVEELIGMLESGKYEALAGDLIESQVALRRGAAIHDPGLKTRLEARLSAILQGDEAPGNPKKRGSGRIWWYAAASVALLLLAVGSYILQQGPSKGKMAAVQEGTRDIAPGGNKAILTLSNGQRIILDSAYTGQLAKQGSSNIIKKDSGVLAYQAAASTGSVTAASTGPPVEGAIQYNTLATPRGGQYQLILPDGTKVWLNAASSIRYPTAFTGKERRVEITGEAYFEVAKDASRPFEVSVENMTVNVLGTRFNINAYGNDEDIRTTLLEGIVKVVKGDQSLLLRPGQAAYTDGNGNLEREVDVNFDGIIAWKNGLFWFDNTDIHDVMQTLSRWYDVDIDIERGLADHFTGYIPRRYTFSKVFEVLQKTGRIHYTMKGNRIIVTN